MAGMEHWLPLLEERLATLFDHLGENDLVIRDAAADKALDSRREAIEDYYQNRVRAMEARAGQLPPARARQRSIVATGRVGRRSSPSARSTSPRLSRSPNPTAIIDFGVEPARDFAPERAQQANVYEAVAKHIGELRRSGHKVVLASYTPRRARAPARACSRIMASRRRSSPTAGRRRSGRKTQPALLVLPLDHGFTTPDVAVLTEQDMLGDRLVRRRKKRKAADAFLDELATLSPGRPRRPRRPRHRPLRGADPDPGQQGARTTASRSNMRAATSSTCRSRISSC